MNLKEELTSVEDELRQARLEMASVGARVEGLVVRRDALAAALRQTPAKRPDEESVSWSTLTKDRAIVEVLRRAPQPMKIGEIVRELANAGRPNENYSGVSVYLDTLLKQSRVERVARGLYTAAS